MLIKLYLIGLFFAILLICSTHTPIIHYLDCRTPISNTHYILEDNGEGVCWRMNIALTWPIVKMYDLQMGGLDNSYWEIKHEQSSRN